MSKLGHSQWKRSVSQSPKSMDLKFFMAETESEYKFWWQPKRAVAWFRNLPDDTLWNNVLCLMALVSIVLLALGFTELLVLIEDTAYNIFYLINALALLIMQEDTSLWTRITLFAVDLGTYVHYPFYVLQDRKLQLVKICCYYVRLHRPFTFLWRMGDKSLKGNVLGTAFKYCYLFMMLRISCALIWLYLDDVELRESGSVNLSSNSSALLGLGSSQACRFIKAFYLIDTIFQPIGPAMPPVTQLERMACLLEISVCLVITGLAIASLSLDIAVYMRPEETFRSRFRLIMDEMRNTHVPRELSEKVDTFYKMYWHKQKAVSETQLLGVFPHTIPVAVYTDIYFEAQQKCMILRDLSYQLLSELAKVMSTTHYIPGDAIIKRNSTKSSIIYITYGDIEMLTAEDDITAILRFTRGTLVSPVGGCVPAACARAHVTIRAATFCTAHVLTARDLWKVMQKYGYSSEQAFIIASTFEEHINRVKKHYATRVPDNAKYKSSIMHLKQNLIALKEAKDEDGKLLLERTDVFLEIAGCYVMRNRADASLTDEADEICLKPTFPCILQPSSSLIVAWSVFVGFIVFVVCIVHPYYLVFKTVVPLEFRFFDHVVTLVFILDLIVHLSTGANVEEGVAITFTLTSSLQMQTKWFVLDVLGTLPIFEFVGDGHFGGMNKLLRMPKLFRVLKDMEEMCVYHSNVLRFLSYSLLIFIMTYMVATFQQGVMCFQFGSCVVGNYSHSPHWLNKTLDDDFVHRRLWYSLYWSISMVSFTSHKTAPWAEDSWVKVVYIIIVLEICLILKIFVEAVYSATIMVNSILRDEYESTTQIVGDFFQKLHPMLRHRFITYLQLCWYTDKAYAMTHDKRSIMYDLPPHVYNDIVSSQSMRYILCIPCMQHLKQEDLKYVASCAKLFYTSPNEILLSTGDISNEMFVIKKGYCEVLNPETKTVVSTLGTKGHFGVLDCILRMPAFYTVKAKTHVQIIAIPRKHLLKALEMPKIKDAINFAKEQPEFTSLMEHREPFVTYEKPPESPNREIFQLPKKHEPDTHFLYPFTRLGFLSILRYIFPRFSIHPDGKYIRRYEWFRAACAFASMLVFPSLEYMKLQFPSLSIVATMLDVAAFFDIIQRMLVGYYNENGILVYHPASTAAHYLRGAFCVDLLGAMPLESLDTRQGLGDRRDRHVSAVTQYLRLNRLMQMYRPMQALNMLSVRRDVVLMLKALSMYIALNNVLTLMVILASVRLVTHKDGDWHIIPHIVTIQNDDKQCWTITFQKNFRFKIMESPLNLQLATFFWVVYETSTTGYNIINPSSLDIVSILVLGMLVGIMINTYFSVCIISVRSNVNKALGSFQEHLRDIVVYMKKEKISKAMQREVTNYYKFTWEKTGGTNYRSVLKLCDQITLRTDTILQIYGKAFVQCPILENNDLSLLRVVGRAVRSVYFLKGTHVILKDDVVNFIYFIDYGIVHASKDGFAVKLPRGSVFGNLENTPTFRCPLTMVTEDNVHLLYINTTLFYDIITDFATVQAHLKHYRPRGECYIVGHEEGEAQGGNRTYKRTATHSAVIREEAKGYMRFLYGQSAFFENCLILFTMLSLYGDLYNTGFQNNGYYLVIALYILDFFFCLKILIQFLLPYTTAHPLLLEELKSNWTQYFNKEFRYDVISVVPVEVLCYLNPDDFWLTFSLLRLNRMFRIQTVYTFMTRHYLKLSINLILSTIVFVSIFFSLFSHTVTCSYFFLAYIEDRANPNTSWRYDIEGRPVCQDEYLCTFYFILTTITQNGVGDIMPKLQTEVIFIAALEILSTIVYMIYVGEFSNIIQYLSFRYFSYYCAYLELQDFMKNNRVSTNLVKIVKLYALHLWRESRGVQVPHFLEQAPHCLKFKVMGAAYMHHLEQHVVFKKCEPAFLRQLVGCFKLFTYNERMFVVKETNITDSMYLVHKGHVEEFDEEMEEINQVYGVGQFFGIFQGLHRDVAYAFSYRTVERCLILTLSLDDWEYLLQHFPASRDIIYDAYSINPDDDSQQSGSNPNEPITSVDSDDLDRLGSNGARSKSVSLDKLGDEPNLAGFIPRLRSYASKSFNSLNKLKDGDISDKMSLSSSSPELSKKGKKKLDKKKKSEKKEKEKKEKHEKKEKEKKEKKGKKGLKKYGTKETSKTESLSGSEISQESRNIEVTTDRESVSERKSLTATDSALMKSMDYNISKQTEKDDRKEDDLLLNKSDTSFPTLRQSKRFGHTRYPDDKKAALIPKQQDPEEIKQVPKEPKLSAGTTLRNLRIRDTNSIQEDDSLSCKSIVETEDSKSYEPRLGKKEDMKDVISDDTLESTLSKGTSNYSVERAPKKYDPPVNKDVASTSSESDTTKYDRHVNKDKVSIYSAKSDQASVDHMVTIDKTHITSKESDPKKDISGRTDSASIFSSVSDAKKGDLSTSISSRDIDNKKEDLLISKYITRTESVESDLKYYDLRENENVGSTYSVKSDKLMKDNSPIFYKESDTNIELSVSKDSISNYSREKDIKKEDLPVHKEVPITYSQKRHTQKDVSGSKESASVSSRVTDTKNRNFSFSKDITSISSGETDKNKETLPVRKDIPITYSGDSDSKDMSVYKDTASIYSGQSDKRQEDLSVRKNDPGMHSGETDTIRDMSGSKDSASVYSRESDKIKEDNPVGKDVDSTVSVESDTITESLSVRKDIPIIPSEERDAITEGISPDKDVSNYSKERDTKKENLSDSSSE